MVFMKAHFKHGTNKNTKFLPKKHTFFSQVKGMLRNYRWSTCNQKTEVQMTVILLTNLSFSLQSNNSSLPKPFIFYCNNLSSQTPIERSNPEIKTSNEYTSMVGFSLRKR